MTHLSGLFWDGDIEFASLVVALAALGVAWRSWVVAMRSWETGDRGARNDVLAQVREWGGDVVDLLAEARGMCEFASSLDPGDLVRARASLRSRASALVDRGRCFFPNTAEGFRPPILDLVLVAYELTPAIQGGPNDKRVGLAFDHVQAAFVSTIKAATNFASAPATVSEYEKHLEKITPKDIPGEIEKMLVDSHHFHFDVAKPSLDKKPIR